MKSDPTIAPFAQSRVKLSPQIEDFFKREPVYDPAQDKLLNIRPSLRWFDQLNRCVQADTYIFQKMYTGRQNPEALVEGRLLQVFSSYDYLGLIGHPDIDQAAIDSVRQFGTGTGGVRLLTGTNQLHDELEFRLSEFLGTESAMVFTSGYLANLAAIAALFDGRDLVVADEYAHRSLVDAIRLAGVPVKTFAHNDPSALRTILENNTSTCRRVLIVVEGIYSMDGDICPLPSIIELKNEFGAILMVDEAHSLGVLGRTGRGIAEHFNIHPGAVDIFTGSLSKAIPSNGGYVATREEVIHYLKHGGAPFMFSGALSPPNTASAIAALDVMKEEGWRLDSLWSNAKLLFAGARSAHVDTGHSQTPIVPLICKSNENAFGLSRHLYDKGYLATSVIYPAVPKGMERIRLCATATMKPQTIAEFSNELRSYYQLAINA
jgi:8-amino-7-oxononanoate synthase